MNNKVPGLKLRWSIKNGSLPDVRQFVSRDLSGSISTSGLGSVPPPNNNNKRHEYTAVIELPNNSVNLVGTLEVDVKSTASRADPDFGVDLLTGESELIYSFRHRNWSDSNAFCSLLGRKLASVRSAYHWQRLKNAVITSNNIYSAFWIGGMDTFARGEWTWTDGSKWSYEHWSLRSGPSMDSNGSNNSCLFIQNNAWFYDACEREHFSICEVSTKLKIKQSSQFKITANNISLPALIFTWPSTSDPQDNQSLSSVAAGLERI